MISHDSSGSMPLTLTPEVLDLLPAAVYVCDAQGHIRYYNRRAAGLWGREPCCNDGRERYCGPCRLYFPDGTPMAPEATPVADALRTGEPQRNRRAVVERPDGSRITVTVNIDPLKDGTGEIVGAINGFEEVTEQRRLFEELRESEERFRGLLSALPAAVYTTDREGRILLFNDAAAELWGRRPEIGEMWCGSFRIFRPDGEPLPLDRCPMAVALQEGRSVRGEEIVVERPDGLRRHVLPHPEPLRDTSGEIVGAVNMLVDITDRKEGEDAVRLLAAIIESSDDAIISKNLEGIITSWNRGAERIFGYTAEEVVGKHISVLVAPDHTEDVGKILGSIRRGERVDHYETKRRTKDGRIIDISLTVSPVLDAAGKIVGASKVARDVTERQQLLARLRENDRKKDEFLAMLAHELRNPLAAINGAVTVLKMSDDEENRRWASDVVERQARHLGRLIDDLLDVSRITSGKIRLRKECLDAAAILGHAIEAVRPLIEKQGHQLATSFTRGTLLVEADPDRLEQIAVNLLTNAAKYTEPGGRIWLTAWSEGGQVVIKVRDTGIGIPPEKLPEMFKLFAQGERSIARSEGGLGIGLTIVERLVEMHGGSVCASSEGPGKGSEFTVRFPAAQKPETPGEPRTSPKATSKGFRILVVDDSVDTARGMARLLKLVGNDVRMAHDGREAIELARAFQPEFVLLDIGLPGMDGYEVAASLKGDDCCKDAVIIGLSGYGQEEDRRRSRAAGFDHHLIKPVDLDALVSLLS